VPPKKDVVVFAAACPIDMGESRFQWGAVFPASTLFVVREDFLFRQILCHEFAHCFWYLTRMAREAINGRWESIEPLNGISNEELFTRQVKKDHNELVDPSEWFGEWDVQHFLTESGDPVWNEPTEMFFERWVDAGFPTRPMCPLLDVSGVFQCYYEILDRAHEVIAKEAK
jgi:hypothetical protein